MRTARSLLLTDAPAWVCMSPPLLVPAALATPAPSSTWPLLLLVMVWLRVRLPVAVVILTPSLAAMPSRSRAVPTVRA